ncbi:LuxR C-terminal-related transcriptional regulator [Tunicatimonas pelagia]|uniref:LuxR C-terminal-related transcriptional regulator n=1 Tax=Tunicatimonas pelagia TaxID=931531 RepID=UPI0026650301|nr:response regulator transcription factor [Tunicatimonas pelagia]WKN43026.1 response regulator transcription factor [Tunicatimonas pelagia]
MIQVLVADNQELASAGIQYLLNGETTFQIVSTVNRWEKVSAEVQRYSPDVLVLDYLFLPGFTIAKLSSLQKQYPSLKFFVLTTDTNHARILKIIKMGVFVFLTKDCSRNEIIRAFQAVADGQKFFCNSVLDLLTYPDTQTSPVHPMAASLTKRERQIIQLIAQEYSSENIAKQLSLSPHTINAHRKRILKKLNVTSPVGLIIQSLHLDIIHYQDDQILLTKRET